MSILHVNFAGKTFNLDSSDGMDAVAQQSQPERTRRRFHS